MESVLTLVARPGHLEESIVARVGEGLNGLGATIGARDWLADGTACDLGFAAIPPAAAQAHVTGVLADTPVDAVAQAAAGRRKGLLMADMDSTVISAESLDELADRAGLKPQIAAITARAMNGEIPYRRALKERVALLAGMAEDALEATMHGLTPTAGAGPLVRTMRANGAVTALVSGGFDYFTGRVAERLGFDHHRGNRVEIVDGRLTGRVAEPIIGKDAKRDALVEIAAAHGIDPGDSLAVGDGANDAVMLAAAGLGVAFRAKPAVAAAAEARIEHADLLGLLYIQGYRDGEIAA